MIQTMRLISASLTFCVSLFVATTPMLAQSPLTVDPEAVDLRGALDRAQLVVMQESDAGLRDTTREVTYQSSDDGVVRVSPSGQVIPVADGQASIAITDGDERREVTVKVSEFQSGAPSFIDDVIPVFNRAGCNGGACHASQYGKGGLKLSLFGYAPEQDHRPLTRDELGRRISRLDPAASLMLQKPTLEASHGGGRRFQRDSIEYSLLLEWIKSGAAGPAKDAPHVIGLKVSPASRVYQPGQQQQLRVAAEYSDGRVRDVTHLAQYDMIDESVASIDDTALVTAKGNGQGAVMVRFMGQAKISTAVVPFAANVDLSSFRARNFVDEHIVTRWRQLGLQPSDECSDEVFVRRAFLDAIGAVPPADVVEQFVNSKDENKHEMLVDALLGLTGDPAKDIYVNQWSAYWTMKWGDLIRNNRNKLGDGGMWALYNWIRSSLRENKPVDEFVRELITAQGSVFESGPANYFKITNKPDELAEATAQTFLGIRLQCAKCHHHPFEVYSQADYYGLAAFFTRVGSKSSADFGSLGGDTVVMVKRSGSIRHPRTRKTMQPTFLRGESIDEAKHRDLRRPLAEWLTSPDNRLFARNIANRYWGYLMGVGLVEPIDDMRETNPASNPELLDALADHLVESKYDLRRLMRAIMTSTAYRLRSEPRPENASHERFHTQYNVKRLPAEVLLDAIDTVCGVQEKFTGIPRGTRAVELPDPNFPSFFLDTMGRPKRVITCECERTTAPNLSQVLHLLNGEYVSKKIADKSGRVAKLLKDEPDDAKAVEHLFLTALGRKPSAKEHVDAAKIIEQAKDRKEGLEDLCWALINSREFIFNH